MVRWEWIGANPPDIEGERLALVPSMDKLNVQELRNGITQKNLRLAGIY